MEDMKLVIAKNIAALRQAAGMTQLELADKLNYSDKAISKWERGESIPDVLVLKTIADLFSVSLDYLLEETHSEHAAPVAEPQETDRRNRSVTTTLSVLLVWFVATMVYVILDLTIPTTIFKWISFAWAVPVSLIVWLVYNSIWFNQRTNYIIVSLLMWTGIAGLVLTLAFCGIQTWQLFYLGILGQIAIFLWSRYKRKNLSV
jgi:transcriptional regulator with XRE-family HTH domain